FFYRATSDSQYQMRCWNTQQVLPDDGILQSAVSTGFAQLANGFYVWNKKDSAEMLAVSLVPIKWNYIVTNDYLKNTFVNRPMLGNQYDIFPGEGLNGTVRSLKGDPLFYLVQKNVVTTASDNVAAVWLRIVAVLLVMLFVHLCAVYIATYKSALHGLGFLLGLLVLLRVTLYVFPNAVNLRQLELFDPTIYGAGFWLRSLGDLLINALMFLWVVLFTRPLFSTGQIKFAPQNNAQRWLLLILGCLLMVFTTFVGVKIVRSLISDSQISFDVINFFSLNIYSIVGFIVLCCLAVGYYFLCQMILFLVKPFFSPGFPDLFITTAATGLLLLSFNLGHLHRGLELYALAWLLLTLFLLNSKILNQISTRIISSKLVFWIFYFSISMTILMIVENSQKELRNRQHYAEVLATKTDPASQSMLNSMLTDFRLDFFSENFERLKVPFTNRFLKDSLINNNISGYTNRYDTRIYSFDETGRALFNDDNSTYEQLNTILNTQAKETAVRGLFYYDESYDRFNYISKKEINDFSGKFLGTIFILVSPKRLKNDMLYPELFSKGSNTAIENSSTYAYAIYIKGNIVISHNDYPFSTALPSLNFKGRPHLQVTNGEYDELWYQAGPEKYIVIAKERGTALEVITLFSYFFCAFLLLSAMFWLIAAFVKSRFDLQKLRSYWQLSIRNQIHGIIIFISALSFIVIGVATILFFISRYQSNNQEKLSRAIQIMKTQVGEYLTDGWQLNDSMLVAERNAATTIERSIINIAEIHGVDINVYDLDGNLKMASLSLPYIKGIVSTKMNPVAYYHMSEQKEIQFFQQEYIGKLAYASSYVPVFDASGKPAAYLNIPYFTSESKLQQEIANFLVTIINLNAFIFLMAGIVALFITNRITGSFALISEQMKKIHLGSVNEPLEWHRNDEIGSLVKEYNNMLA
ncbi:MAG: HAMP domain-containing protein, partial [Chitinophagaceae bacterium]